MYKLEVEESDSEDPESLSSESFEDGLELEIVGLEDETGWEEKASSEDPGSWSSELFEDELELEVVDLEDEVMGTGIGKFQVIEEIIEIIEIEEIMEVLEDQTQETKWLKIEDSEEKAVAPEKKDENLVHTEKEITNSVIAEEKSPEQLRKEESDLMQDLLGVEVNSGDKEVIVNVNKLGDEEIGNNEPFNVSLKLNDIKTDMELDTGASVSVMGTEKYNSLGGEPLRQSRLRLKTCTGEIVRPRGIGYLKVEYGKHKYRLPITVVDGPVPTLLGRNWLKEIRLDWESIVSQRKQDNGDRKNKKQEKEKSNNSEAEVHKLEEGKLFENLKAKYPEVFRKCLRLWKKKKLTGMFVHVSDLKEIFPEIFSNQLGCLKDLMVHIPVPVDATPRFFKPRSVPYALRTRVEDELDKLEKQGVWKKVQYSKWAAPIVTVLKDAKNPGGAIRICGDYKITVNAVAQLDNYPIPNTTEQLATLAGGKKFSKIDLRQAYQQLALDDESKELLTVNTHKGLYQPERLQFGVHSATGIFQREIERILQDFPSVLVRIDDILMTGKTDEEHFWTLVWVLLVLEEAGFTVGPEKCEFFKEEVTFCGYRVSQDGVLPMEKNVKAVLEAPEPTNISELKSFLGMINYYQNYLPALATVVEPIHKLLRKDAPWNWNNEQQQAFETAKKMLSEAPLLVHFDPAQKIVVHTDASPYGLGSVLSHLFTDETEKPVCFASRSLSKAERNYGHIEKEGLALVFAVKKFHHYLFGHKFTIFTDHKPLLGLFGENKGIPDRSAARIARWALLLSGYDYKLEYRQGSMNGNADALSRLPLSGEDEEESQQVVGVHMMELSHSPVTEEEVRVETAEDKILSAVMKYISEGWRGEVVKEEGLKPYLTRKNELSTEGGCVLWGGRVVIPEKLRQAVLEELHDVHPGMTRMKALARSYVWWPNMDQEIEQISKHCETCCVNQNNPSSAPMHMWEQPDEPWERIHLDYAGPFMGRMFLIVVDAYSKWIEVETMTDATAYSTVHKLRRMFAAHGLPKVMVTDNGPAFTGESFEKFSLRNGIRHVPTAPYHPASNGQAERVVRTFKESMKKLSKGDIETKVNRLLFKYRMTPHTSTGVSPSQLMLKREIRTPFHLIQPGSKITPRPEARSDARKFREGDLVWSKNFGLGDKWVPGIVESVRGNVNYNVSLVGKKETVHRHIDQLRERFQARGEVRTTEAERDDVEVEPPQESSEVTLTPTKEENPILRRTTRESKKPSWRKDYVTQ